MVETENIILKMQSHQVQYTHVRKQSTISTLKERLRLTEDNKLKRLLEELRTGDCAKILQKPLGRIQHNILVTSSHMILKYGCKGVQGNKTNFFLLKIP